MLMPLISQVGRKSLGGRVAISTVYLLLIGGSVTMIVPFLMTLTASMSSAYDVEKYRLWPRYLWDDDELYAKYLLEKYPSTYFSILKDTHQLIGVASARDLIRAEHPGELLPEVRAYFAQPRPNYEAIRRDYHEFLKTYPAEKLATPYFIDSIRDQWRNWLRQRYIALARQMGLLKDDADAEKVALTVMNRAYGEVVADSFNSANFPEGSGYAPRSYWRNAKQTQDYRSFLGEQEVSCMLPQRGDDQYRWWLVGKYGLIENLNVAWKTNFSDFVEIVLPASPPTHPKQCEDWQNFFATGVRLSWVNVPASYAGSFRDFLKRRLETLEHLSTRLGKTYQSWDQVPFTSRYDGVRAYRDLWSEFVLREVPVADRGISYFEKEYAAFLRTKYGNIQAVAALHRMPETSFDEYRVPYAGLDYDEFYNQRGHWRWHFLTDNFIVVLRYIATKGRALWNTLILVGLTVLGGLTINPLAAFALSRFHIRNLQLILLFLLIPMAFPAEISMIPSFLLLRQFPLALVTATAAAAIGVLTWQSLRGERDQSRASWKRLVLAAAVCLVIWSIPVLGVLAGMPREVPLLNSYVALIMPGLANGFSIFLLKGFFDGLPRELYEAAQIDGASEFRMFRMITYPLSKPIIVLTITGGALGAYGGFMWAFVVVPDERMWTLMVWLYQFTTDYASYRISLVMAALVVASLPTLVFFAFCQRVILRGIILPTMK